MWMQFAHQILIMELGTINRMYIYFPLCMSLRKYLLAMPYTRACFTVCYVCCTPQPRWCRSAGSAHDLWPAARWSYTRADWLLGCGTAERRHNAKEMQYCTRPEWKRTPAERDRESERKRGIKVGVQLLFQTISALFIHGNWLTADQIFSVQKKMSLSW